MTMTRRTALTAGIGATLSPSALTAQGSVSSIDPIMPLYREWSEQRAEWFRFADMPGNEDWDWPESLEAQRREEVARKAMLDLTPKTKEGIAALAHVLWTEVGPSFAEWAEEYEDDLDRSECKLIAAIWRAASGQSSLPA